MQDGGVAGMRRRRCVWGVGSACELSVQQNQKDLYVYV